MTSNRGVGRYHDNPNYWIHLTSNKAGVNILAFMPAEFSINISSAWESKLASIASGAFSDLARTLGGFANLAGQAAGVSGIGTLKTLTYQSWISSQPLEFQIPLLFDSYISAKTDVWDPMISLLKLAAPGAASANQVGFINSLIADNTEGDVQQIATHISGEELLVAPGPLAVSGTGLDEIIELTIGTRIRLSRVILKSVDLQFDSLFDHDGYPIAGQANIAISTQGVPSKNDIDRWFGGPFLPGATPPVFPVS